MRVHAHRRISHVPMRRTHQHRSHVGVRRTWVHHVHSHRKSSSRSGDRRRHWSHTVHSWASDGKLSSRMLWTLPSLFGDLHGKFCPALVLNLASLVNEFLRSSKVHAVGALTLTPTHDSGLEALAVLLQTFRALAFTSHVMSALRSQGDGALQALDRDSWFKSVRVLGTGILHGLVADACKCINVLAISTVAAFAKKLGCETFTIQLQALGLLAVAGASLGCRCCSIFFSARSGDLSITN